MTEDVCRRLLGVPSWSDPATLLGLPFGPVDAATVEEALRRRLALLLQERSAEAESARRLLRRAARELLSPAPAAPSVRGITEFDRLVLAVLIGSGGWNAASRARLVSLAAAYGVSVDGLIKVVAGLARHAREGAGMDLVRIAAGGAAAAPRAPQAVQPEALQWLGRVAPELREEGPAAAWKLSILFALVTVLAGVMLVKVLLPAHHDARRSGPVPSEAALEGSAAAPAPRQQAPPPARPDEPARLSGFDSMPTFLGHALSAEAARAADECAGLPAHLDSVARRISVSQEPSEAVFRNWEDSLRTASLGWVLIDDSVHESVVAAILGVLHAAADSPRTSDRLLAGLSPGSGRFAEPTDVWRGAWAAGMLARIAASPGLAPAVVERGRIQLELALPQLPAGRLSFEAAAAAWLAAAIGPLVQEIEYDPRAADFWECWIGAERRLGRRARFEEAVMDAIGAVMSSPGDLARPGPRADVLGRLLLLCDWNGSTVVRDRFLRLFDSPQEAGIGEKGSADGGIGSRSLWVVTSLLAEYGPAPWFGDDLILPEDADWIFRRRLADRIGRRWPPIETPPEAHAAPLAGAAADPALGARWAEALATELGRPTGGAPVPWLERLVAAARLNEAACRLQAGELESAGRLIAAAESSAEPAGGAPAPPPPRTGQSRGNDGQWAIAFQEAGNDIEQRLKLLGDLRSTAGTDLGPIDADLFVETVYRGSRQDLRDRARSILTEQFSGGPNVALEMLGQFPNAPRNELTSDLLRGYTSAILPAARSESWEAAARLALVEHALRLRRAADDRLDRQVELLCESWAGSAAALDPEPVAAPASTDWREATALLVESWRRLASAAAESGGGRSREALGEMDKRHAARLRLVEGPLQGFVAAQLAVADLMAFTATAVNPALELPAARLLRDSAETRRRAAHVLEQAVEAERLIGRLWRLQIVAEASG